MLEDRRGEVSRQKGRKAWRRRGWLPAAAIPFHDCGIGRELAAALAYPDPTPKALRSMAPKGRHRFALALAGASLRCAPGSPLSALRGSFRGEAAPPEPLRRLLLNAAPLRSLSRSCGRSRDRAIVLQSPYLQDV